MSESVSESNELRPASPRDGDGVEMFDEILAVQAGAVRLYVRSLMPGYEGAEDVAQEALLKAWEKREEYAAGTNFKAWVFQIARYLVMNQRRKVTRREFVPLDEELMDQIDHFWLRQEAMASQREHEALTQCLGGLKPEDRELLHARYATEASLETFAERTGARVGTLKARLFRLREALRRCLELRLGPQ
jgi:RNA polymerase sigma-70 factor (ECF subfamily)